MAAAENTLTPFTHKRSAFAHEQEVRALLWRTAALAAGSPVVSGTYMDRPKAVEVGWDATKTLEAVYVSPYADEWYRDAVADVIASFAPTLSGCLRWSGMRGDPLY
jgi:hypothetical protein